MKLYNLIIMLLTFSKLYSQPVIGKIHFQYEGKSNSFAATGYTVNCLTLNSDFSFIWQELTFDDKKIRRKCIPSRYTSNEGSWSRSGDNDMFC